MRWRAAKLFVGMVACLPAVAARGEVKIAPKVVEVDAKVFTPVYLDLEQVTVQEAFDAVCQLSPLPCRVAMHGTEGEKRISVKFEGTSLAEALVKIAAQAEVGLARESGDFCYRTTKMPSSSGPGSERAGWIHGPTCNDGPFCGVLDHMDYSRCASWSRPGEIKRTIQLVVDTVPEPQVMVCSSRAWLKLPKVVDEKGQRFRDTVTNDEDFRAAMDSVDSRTGLLEGPRDAGKELAELTVERRYQIVRQFRRIEIDGQELAKGARLESDGVTLEWTPAVNRRASGKEYMIKLTASGQGDADLLAAGTMCAMIDDGGRIMERQRRMPQQQDGVVTLVYRLSAFEPADKMPVRVVVLLPLEKMTVMPTYRFEHIPLVTP